MRAVPSNPWQAVGAILVAVVLLALAAGRIISTYTEFNQTSDEPFHVAAGMEWLDRGRYTYEAQHPPLARVAAAIGPYLLGRRSEGKPDARTEGKAIFLDGGNPVENVAAARVGILPFFIVAALVVWTWATDLGGRGAGLAALLVFTTFPPALAHSGLATNDAAVMAFVAMGIWSFQRWLAAPRPAAAALVGIAWALAILSKLSALLFLPVGAAAVLVVWGLAMRGTRLSSGMPSLTTVAQHVVLACSIGFVLIWSAYRFSVAYPGALGGKVPIPAPELWRGVMELFAHNERGHLAYLFGQTSRTGWWYFFPVAIGVKTPLPFLLLIVIGAWACIAAYRDRHWRLVVPLVTSVAMLLAIMPININIGLRYILPIFPALAVVAGLGAMSLWHSAKLRAVARISLVALLAWLVVDTTRAHPHYLAYFNEVARQEPERILVDSDLDWGQDFSRLVAEVERRRIDAIAVAFWGSVDLDKQGVAGMRRLRADERPVGWVAASEIYRSGIAGAGFRWLQQETPVAKVGQTIRLYHFPASP